MNREEALKLLHKGEEVINTYYEFRYFYSKGSGILCYKKVNGMITVSNGLPVSNNYELVKKTKTVRFWKFVDKDGDEATKYYTEDRNYYYAKGRAVWTTGGSLNFGKTKSWIKTNCFIDVEVEE